MRSAPGLEGQLQKTFGQRFQGQKLLVVAIDDVGLKILRDVDKANLLIENEDRKIVSVRILQNAWRNFSKPLDEFDA